MNKIGIKEKKEINILLPQNKCTPLSFSKNEWSKLSKFDSYNNDGEQNDLENNDISHQFNQKQAESTQIKQEEQKFESKDHKSELPDEIILPPEILFQIESEKSKFPDFLNEFQPTNKFISGELVKKKEAKTKTRTGGDLSWFCEKIAQNKK